MRRVINASARHGELVERLRPLVERGMEDSGAENVALVFVSHDPTWEEENIGGWHEHGPEGSVCVVFVDDEMTGKEVLELALHELRHAWQAEHPNEEWAALTRKMWERDGLAAPTPEWSWGHHDNLPEEVDADWWAEREMTLLEAVWLVRWECIDALHGDRHGD